MNTCGMNHRPCTDDGIDSRSRHARRSCCRCRSPRARRSRSKARGRPPTPTCASGCTTAVGCRWPHWLKRKLLLVEVLEQARHADRHDFDREAARLAARRRQRRRNRAEAYQNGGPMGESLRNLLLVADEHQAGPAGVRRDTAVLGTRVQIAVKVGEYVGMSGLDRLGGNHRQLLSVVESAEPKPRCFRLIPGPRGSSGTVSAPSLGCQGGNAPASVTLCGKVTRVELKPLYGARDAARSALFGSTHYGP